MIIYFASHADQVSWLNSGWGQALLAADATPLLLSFAECTARKLNHIPIERMNTSYTPTDLSERQEAQRSSLFDT